MNTEARSSIDNLLTTLKERLAQPGKSLLPLLGVMSRFAKYSLANQILIFAQRPTPRTCWATAPGTRPATRSARASTASRSTRRCSSRKRESSRLRRPTAAPRLGYRVAYVFDIAQVDAIAGTDAAAVTATPADTGAHRHLEALKAFLVGHNVELEYKALAPGLLGYTNGRRITCGTGQASHVEFATLAHETTHVLLHFPADAARAPTSPRARPRPKPSPTCSARNSESPAPRPPSSTSSPTAARPTRWTPRSSASAPPRSGSPPSSPRSASTWSTIPARRSRASKYPQVGPAKPIQGAIRDCTSRAAGGGRWTRQRSRWAADRARPKSPANAPRGSGQPSICTLISRCSFAPLSSSQVKVSGAGIRILSESRRWLAPPHQDVTHSQEIGTALQKE